jgi:hypothetical protein
MPITEIIHEIDTYLSRLRQAREVLLGPMAEDAQKRVPPSKGKVLVGQTDPVLSSRGRVEENRSRSNHRVTDQKRETEHGDGAAQLSSGVAQESVDSERPATLKPEPERTTPRHVLVTRVPARRRNGSVKSAHHPITNSALRAKPEAPKPAIALAGSISGRIVVVSAEQVRLEREAACPAVRSPRLPGTGLTGRRAFEALFKDQAAPSAQ